MKTHCANGFGFSRLWGNDMPNPARAASQRVETGYKDQPMRHIAIALGLALLTTSAMAQSGPVMQMPAIGAPAAQPAPAVPPAPAFPESHMAAARELLQITGTFNSFQNILPEFRGNMLQTNITRPELQKPIEEIVAGLKPEADRLVKVMEDRACEFMALRMSEEEMKEVTAFFKTPTGRKYLDQRPVAMADIFNALQPWSQLTSNFLFERTKAELEKRGFKL
jgi:hypothetical protein